MNAELARFERHALPRWTALVVLGVAVNAGVLLWLIHPSVRAWYEGVALLAALVYVCGVAVVGVWAGVLEFTAGTLNASLAEAPNRNRLLVHKAAAVALFGFALGFAASGVIVAFEHLAVSASTTGYDTRGLVGAAAECVVLGVFVGIGGMGLGLLTRSLTWGITIAFAVIAVVLAFAPVLGLDDLVSRGEAGGAAPAVGVIAMLCVLLALPGWIRFLRDDFS